MTSMELVGLNTNGIDIKIDGHKNSMLIKLNLKWLI